MKLYSPGRKNNNPPNNTIIVTEDRNVVLEEHQILTSRLSFGKKISSYDAGQQNVSPFQLQPLPVSKWAFVTFTLMRTLRPQVLICLSLHISPLFLVLMPLTAILCCGRQEETMETNSLPSSCMKCHGVFTDEHGWGQVNMEGRKSCCWKDDRPSFKKCGFGGSLLN